MSRTKPTENKAARRMKEVKAFTGAAPWRPCTQVGGVLFEAKGRLEIESIMANTSVVCAPEGEGEGEGEGEECVR